MRVYEVAKELGLGTKVVVQACQELGMPVKTHSSSLTAEQVARVRRRFRPPAGSIEAALAAAAALQQERPVAPAPPPPPAAPAPPRKPPKKAILAQPVAHGARKAAPKKVKRPPAAARRPERPPAPPEPGSAAAAEAAATAVVGKEPVPAVDAPPVIRMEEETREERLEKRVSLAPSVQELLRKYAVEPERQRVMRRRRRRPKKGERALAVKQPLIIKRRRKITLDFPVTVKSLSAAIGIKANVIMRHLLEQGVMATINTALAPDVAHTIALEQGLEIDVRTERDLETEIAQVIDDRPEDLVLRAPVVAFLGHVDHGKTSLLDAIRKTHVADSESGGITQHIGAYRVEREQSHVVFLDTPGHEAFTAMRARGAKATDIVVLVVAADDGVMPQTEEAINHAKAAGVPIVVALNKMDKREANPDRVKSDLAKLGLVPEEWGGETIFVETSATTGQGLPDLVEMLSLQAEMLDLKGNPHKPATGVVLEAELTEGQGVVATLLVQDGTLKPGDVVLGGPAVGRIRAIVDDKGRALIQAGPSMPVLVSGLSDLPEAGDAFRVVHDLQTAKEIAETRQRRLRQISLGERQHITLENLFSSIKEGKTKELRIIVKADVKGSLEVLQKAITDLSSGEVRVKLIHAGVGSITQSDIDLADASDAIVVGFHVVPEEQARLSAGERGVDVRLYQVIYMAIEELKLALEGLLEPAEQEVVTGHAEVRQLFHIDRFGTIAGCYVNDGTIARIHQVRVKRSGEVLATGPIVSLKRQKDDQREVREGFECGIRIEGFDGYQVGDILEAFTIEKVPRRLTKPV